MGTPWEMRRCDGDTDKATKKCRICSKPDNLTSLPRDLLGRILSLFPTKDVAVMRVVSKSMRGSLSLVKSVDLDDGKPGGGGVDRFPLFKSFVDNVLQTLSPSEVLLTRFRLHFGGEKSLIPLHPDWDAIDSHEQLRLDFPYLEPARLSAWISYPLTHATLKELDLSFRIWNYEECNNLPSQLFNSRSLEVLRVDGYIRIDGADIPRISLPNLKLMRLISVVFCEDEFVTRLVSSCPVLEDLTIRADWDKFEHITISSHCLRRLVLYLSQTQENVRPNSVTIDTPNLKYFDYCGELAHHYSITHMNALFQAQLATSYDHGEPDFPPYKTLLSSLSRVQHFTLCNYLCENYDGPLPADFKDLLSMFRNLRSISLPRAPSPEQWRGELLLLSVLHSSPSLESLVFPSGAYEKPFDGEGGRWGTNTLPSLSLTHLTRIEFRSCRGSDRELDMIKYFFGKAPALKELVLWYYKDERPRFEAFSGKLKELPKASSSCFITLYQKW